MVTLQEMAGRPKKRKKQTCFCNLKQLPKYISSCIFSSRGHWTEKRNEKKEENEKCL